MARRAYDLYPFPHGLPRQNRGRRVPRLRDLPRLLRRVPPRLRPQAFPLGLPSAASDPSPPPPPDSRPEHRMVPYVLQRNVDGFAKRPFLSMEVLASRELLLTLSESVAFHRLPDLKTVAVLTEASGANACSWDDKRGFLCFARQKNVCIFRHDGGSNFVEVKEFGVPDTVRRCRGAARTYTVKNIPKYAPAQFYIDNVLPRIKEKKIMVLKPFVDRLGNQQT
ncbi:hypothetical protein NL676_022803 [Syzygium grande]|nr:hypothetical protein NL676_022803 [Syzygium grande]